MMYLYIRHRFLFFYAALFILSGSIVNGDVVREWKLGRDSALISCRSGASYVIVQGKTEEIKITLPEKQQKWPPVVAFKADKNLIVSKKIRISFEAQSSNPLQAKIAVSDFNPPYTHVCRAELISLSKEWKTYSIDFSLYMSSLKSCSGNLNLPLLMFKDYSGETVVKLRNIMVHEHVPKKAAQWKAIDTGSLYIRKATALDLSNICDRTPAGSYGRVIVNSSGQLVLEKKPDEDIRFFSLQYMPTSIFYNHSRERISELAEMISRQGYNMVRFHFFDKYILASSRGAALKKVPEYKLPETSESIVFDAKNLDTFFYFINELKKRGIYTNLDLMTSYVGYDNGEINSVDRRGLYNTKIQMYVNPMFRNNWKAGVTKLMTTVNPYTGLALKDDPAIALVLCLNEQEILVNFRDYSKIFKPEWVLWLKKKYGTYEALLKVWDGKCGRTALPPDGNFASVPGINSEAVKDSPAGRDMAQFCREKEYEMSSFYLNALKDIGYKGLVSNWNMRTRLCTVPARSQFPVITMNCYHAHPSYGDKLPSVSQRSALRSGGNSFKNQAVARFLDRPFFNTEFGLVFWNPFRHEQGLLFGAGAALQNWSDLSCHSKQVVKSGSSLRWFRAGDDPVIRASELVTAFAFLRKDIKASPHTIEIPVDDNFIFGGRAMRTISDEFARLWPLCRIGITYGKKQCDVKADLKARPGETSEVGGGLMFTSVKDSDSTSQMTAVVNELKKRRVLSKSNRSNPAKGILQSDTGQILLDTANGGELFVTSPRLEGAVLKRDKATKLNSLNIRQCSVPASITVISLDSSKSIAESAKLLLVISTDARNSNMRFSGKGNHKLAALGKLPVLIKTGLFKMNIASTEGSKKIRCFALKLNGERAEEIPVKQHKNSFQLMIDTSALATAGPTPFYEIVKNN